MTGNWFYSKPTLSGATNYQVKYNGSHNPLNACCCNNLDLDLKVNLITPSFGALKMNLTR